MEEETNNEEIEIVEEGDGSNEKVRKLKKELDACKIDKEEYLKGWQRAKADYINLSKSTSERERYAIARSTDDILRDMLDIVDNLEYAFTHDMPDSPWVLGIRNTYNKLLALLKKYDIAKIEVKDTKFDPTLHEAIEIEETANTAEDDTIIEELQSGYVIKGRVLRPSKVKVAHYKKE